MRSKFNSAILFALLLSCLVACTFGKKPSVKKEYLQVFYQDGITEAKANQLLEFLYPLWRNDGAATRDKTVQLTKTADTVNFRMVITPDKIPTVTPESIGAFIQLLSDTVFESAPLNIVLCDDHFKEQKTIRYSEDFRKGPVSREADNKARFGNRYHSGTAEVYVMTGVDQAYGDKLATYFDESKGTGEVHASFQVLKDGDGYIVKMATSPEFAEQTPDSAFKNMANSLSKDIFGGAAVRFVLADLMFKDMKGFDSGAN